MKYGQATLLELVEIQNILASTYERMRRVVDELDEPERTFLEASAENVFQAMRGGGKNLHVAISFVKERTRGG